MDWLLFYLVFFFSMMHHLYQYFIAVFAKVKSGTFSEQVVYFHPIEEDLLFCPKFLIATATAGIVVNYLNWHRFFRVCTQQAGFLYFTVYFLVCETPPFEFFHTSNKSTLHNFRTLPDF